MLVSYFYAYVPLGFLVLKWRLNITKIGLIRDFWNASNVCKMPEQRSTIQSVNKASLDVAGYLCSHQSVFTCSHGSWI